MFRDVGGQLGWVGGHHGVSEVVVVHGLGHLGVHTLHHMADDEGCPLQSLGRGEVGGDDPQP